GRPPHPLLRGPAMSAPAVVRWWFADRRTGRLVVVQRPNALSLTTAGGATLGAVLPGRAGRVARAVGEVAAAVWGLDAALRGVNPWRRTVGCATLVVQALRLARH